MADVTFHVRGVPRHAGAMAERQAVLRRIASKATIHTDEATKAAALSVLIKWRRVLVGLKEAGWGPAQSVKFQYMRNCPPAGVDARPAERETVRPCNQSTVCPWCWARTYVAATYARVWEVMTRTGDAFAKDGPGEYPHRLVTRVDTSRSTATDPSEVTAMLGYYLDKTARAARAKAAGGFLLGAVQPRPNGGWTWSARALLLVPRDGPPLPGVVAVDHPTRRKVAAAVARFARYPLGLMTGDARAVRSVLEARGSVRLYRAFGVFSRNTAGGAGEAVRHLDL